MYQKSKYVWYKLSTKARGMQRTAQSQKQSEEVIYGIFWKAVCWWSSALLARLSGTGWSCGRAPGGQCRRDGKKSCLCRTLKKREGRSRDPCRGDRVGRSVDPEIYTVWFGWRKSTWMMTLLNIKTVSSKCSDLASVLLKSGMSYTWRRLLRSTHWGDPRYVAYCVAEIISHTKEHDIVLAQCMTARGTCNYITVW